MKNYNLKAMKNQAGMTLIELTVVLLVLIGLAGLTLPYVSGFIGKTHNSTSAAAGADLFSALQIYQTQNTGLPNNLNTLTVANTAFIPNFLDNTWTANATTTAAAAAAAAISTVGIAGPTANFSYLAVVPGAGADLSLQAAGINFVSTFQATPGASFSLADGTFGNTAASGATFTPEATGVPIANVAGLVTDTVGGLNTLVIPAPGAAYGAGTGPSSGIANALNYTPPLAGASGASIGSLHRMIVLGIGASNSAVGKTLASVPVHFGDKGNLQPTYTYSRFLAAVDVDTNGIDAAKVIGIVHAPDQTDRWESLYSSIAGYYGG